ncbi:chromosome condensation protein [Babesia ovata]|uniref:Chromosome condensation protein n=1 Tax=Babesia ovata TaxID=189622 RepID=A0A2H6KD89_9APIC|nr:chromosome condensation protein [Babesia ovata]GBE60957.1 chromosome condensation protein [Babesia ovata]
MTLPLSPAGRPSGRNRVADHVRSIGAETRDASQPVRRLIISKVVLRNFKSYGGTTVIGPFHKRFTSIVGPNGSGKSNVIDAMLFVFGFRAKQMRFSKLSDLIHNSQAYLQLNKGRPLDSMEVAVHFCEIIDRDADSDEFEVVPGSELVISREVHRDNSSRYRINGRTATQKDVSNSLKAFGMDLYNNRFLILQGEVEQIAQMKPKATKPEEEGLLEYLEDIIGTNQYLEAIKEAQKCYDEMQDQYQERFNRARVAQKEVEDMLEPKREADAYLAKEKSLLHAQAILARKELSILSDQHVEITGKLATLQEQCNSATAELEAVRKERDTALSAIKGVEGELSQANKVHKRLMGSLQRMIAKDEDLRKQLLREVTKVEEKTAGIKRANSNKPKLEKEFQEKIKQSEELLKQLPSVQEELDSAERALEALTETLKPELLEANRQLAKHESELAPLQQACDQAQKEVSVLKSSIDLLENKRKGANEMLKTLKDTEQKLTKSLKTHSEDLERQEKELTKQRTLFETNKRQLAELESTVRDKSHRCTQKRGEYESMKRELDDIMGSKDQYGYIMGLVATGKIRGVHGRLGDLGSISPEYERAFMAAGGGQVDVIVVDTPDVASQVFDELRKRNLGRSSAMALSVLNHDLKRQMEAFERKSHSDLPPDVQYLIHLVKPSDPKYKVCFYSALRETLLAPDLEVATRVGYQQRRRVVTLNGELIEPDGRMSGGGIKPPKSGGINTKADGGSGAQGGRPVLDAAQLEQFLKEVEKETSELNALKRQLTELTEQQGMLSRTISELQYGVEMLKHTVVNEELQLNELLERIKAIGTDERASRDIEKLAAMQSELNAKEKAAVAAAAKVAAQEKFVAEAYAAVDRVGKGKLKSAKDRVADLETKLSEMRTAIERMRKQAASLQADADKCTRDTEKFTKEIDQHKVRESELERQLNDLEEEAAGVTNEMNGINTQMEELNAKIKELNEGLAARNKRIEEHDLKFVDMRHSIDELSKKLKACEHQLQERQEKLRGILEAYRKSCALIQRSNEAQKLLSQDASSDGTGADPPNSLVFIDDEDAKQSGRETNEAMGDAQSNNADAAVGNDGAADAAGEQDTGETGSGKNSVNHKANGKSAIKVEATDESDARPENAGETQSDEDDPSTTPSDAALIPLNVNALREKVEMLKKQIGAVPNLGVLDDFGLKAHEYSRKRQELTCIQERREEAKRTFDQLCFKRKNEFLLNFAIIAAKLKEIYQSITLGGDAELELVDSTDPFTEGILFSVRPARKSWKQIQNLSGGEKTLSSLALVFALHHYKPNPVYFMDEIDAALDFRNVSIIAQNIKERTKDAQFIIISLRSQMFELCNQMPSACSRWRSCGLPADAAKYNFPNTSHSEFAMENLFSDDESPEADSKDSGPLELMPDLKLEPPAMKTDNEDQDDDGIDICSSAALLELAESNPALLIPSVLPEPKEIRAAESSVMEFFNTPGTHFMHIQMPNAMPHLDKERTLHEDTANRRDGRFAENTSRHATHQAPEDPQIYQTSRVDCLPSGRLGKLRIHRSGKIQLHVGGHVFNFAQGSRVSCKQQVGCLLEENDEFLFLGNYRKKFVVSPDFSAMWNKQ